MTHQTTEQSERAELKSVIVGRLPTLNQDDYPDLGDWWVQLRIGQDHQEVLARVYGSSPQEAHERASAIAALLAATPAAGGGEAVAWVHDKGTEQQAFSYSEEFLEHIKKHPRLYGGHTVAAGGGEAVGRVYEQTSTEHVSDASAQSSGLGVSGGVLTHKYRSVQWTLAGEKLPIGTLLYTHPQPIPSGHALVPVEQKEPGE